LGSQEDAILSPREIVDLQEHGRVVDVAAGRRHTIVLIAHGDAIKAYGFGANDLRQLGLEAGHPAFERPVILNPVEIKAVSRLRPFKVGTGTSRGGGGGGVGMRLLSFSQPPPFSSNLTPSLLPQQKGRRWWRP
jgi:hypothetical protein